MAIIQKKPTTSQEPTFRPAVESKPRQSVFVNNAQVPATNVQSYTSGYTFVVTYYHQAIHKDSVVQAEDVSTSKVFQQYTKIKELEIKVTSPNSSDQNDEDKVFVTRGSAIVHSGIIPNTGDMFSADLGDGRLAVYNITRSQRLSIMKESVYQIEYSMSFIASQEPERLNALESKVIVTYHYVRDFLRYGQSPLLLEQEHQAHLDLNKLYRDLWRFYCQHFFSDEYKTFVIPGQPTIVIDAFVLDLISLLAVEDEFSYKLQQRQPINIQDDNYLKSAQLFKALKYRDISSLSYASTEMFLASTAQFALDPVMENIRYTGIDYIVYPKSLNTHLDDKRNHLLKFDSSITLSTEENLFDKLPSSLYEKTIDYDDRKLKLIHTVDIHQSYVLSNAFYDWVKTKEANDQLSLLEVLVTKYFLYKDYKASLINLIAKDYLQWKKVDQFYLIPVILLLIQSKQLHLK